VELRRYLVIGREEFQGRKSYLMKEMRLMITVRGHERKRRLSSKSGGSLRVLLLVKRMSVTKLLSAVAIDHFHLVE
jgi:hypothetical protein